MAIECACPTCGQPIPEDGLIVDAQNGYVILGPRRVKLRGLQFHILKALAEVRPNILTYDRLISRVWGLNEPDDVRGSICVNLSKLRPKIAPLGIDVRTVYGEGLYLSTDRLEWKPGRKAGRPRSVGSPSLADTCDRAM
jgi:DNA-binding response OmpR family regulator